MTAGVTRGRCFERKSNGAKQAKLTPEVKLASIKVTRADGTVETIDNG